MKILLIALMLISVSCYAMKWECEKLKFGLYATICRAKTPHGWLVKQYRGLTYVPDENHEWKLK